MLASEYGWSKNDIFYNTYPDEIKKFTDAIFERRKQNHLISLLITTNPHLKSEDQKRLFNELRPRPDYLDHEKPDIIAIHNLKAKLSSTKGSSVVVK